MSTILEQASVSGLTLDLPPAQIETHVSLLHLAGDLVFKVKKPSRTDFLDFSTLEQREIACRREVDLNRRLAPDTYLGVAHLSSSPGAEPVVVMRRQPAERSLATLATSGADLRPPLAQVAGVLARFHHDAPHSRRISGAGAADTVLARWEDNLAQLRRVLPKGFDLGEVDELGAAGRQYVLGRGKLFRERIRARRVCDGHGDLLASDVFCPVDSPPQILDCLEFDDGLRYGDGLADVAFLAMDLERLGRLDAAQQLLAAYRAAAEDDWPASLAHFYIAHRAAIRAKVACLRSVVLDATWASPTHRRWAQRQATRSATVLVELEADAPQEVAEVRLRSRAADPSSASDADVEIARRIRDRFAPWPAAQWVDTTRSAAKCAAATYAALVDAHAPL